MCIDAHKIIKYSHNNKGDIYKYFGRRSVKEIWHEIEALWFISLFNSTKFYNELDKYLTTVLIYRKSGPHHNGGFRNRSIQSE
jgi:hypothetical protein